MGKHTNKTPQQTVKRYNSDDGLVQSTLGCWVMGKDYDKLARELTAERARRIKAEEVVDAIIANEGCCIQHADESAQRYRAQYPRVETVEALAPNKEG